MELVRNNIGEIIKKHLEFELSLKSSVHIAVELGEMLVEQKSTLPSGSFTSWVDENLPFTIRTAQNYMKLYEKRDVLALADPANITEAYLVINPKPEEEEEEEEPIETMDEEDTITEVNTQTSIADYWDHLGPLVDKMDAAYNRLARLRDSTTPVAIGHLIGNIKDMANVLATWDPDSLKMCQKCKGNGCDECGNSGLVGLWKRSEN